MKVLGKIWKAINSVFKFIFLALIKGYQYLLSPMLGASCRFTPTCSQYTKQAIEKYGPFKGTYLGIKRILKCHPWGKSGYDPVP
ncbi:MAG TPA: membrane protein insertion efficiency factor YidD [Candidatus Sphingobacterium stercoripullorum]|nr:membrane protein insertion efficiency factor YidD [Candidatus Sphingobacterium stercoripullorum]